MAALTFEVENWQEYRMDWRGDPHPVMESAAAEIDAVDRTLKYLVDTSILLHSIYGHGEFLAHRAAVRENFDIPWTGISPRMQRLLYAINAIHRPAVMVAMGVFCGNTFISNAGASIGPGACYRAKRLVGIEIIPAEAERARRNVAIVDVHQTAEILAADGVDWLRHNDQTIDLLYIDANGSYLDIIREASRHGLVKGSLVLAHNSVNLAVNIADYLCYVRDPANTLCSVNVCIDDQGLEVSLWRRSE